MSLDGFENVNATESQSACESQEFAAWEGKPTARFTVERACTSGSFKQEGLAIRSAEMGMRPFVVGLIVFLVSFILSSVTIFIFYGAAIWAVLYMLKWATFPTSYAKKNAKMSLGKETIGFFEGSIKVFAEDGTERSNIPYTSVYKIADTGESCCVLLKNSDINALNINYSAMNAHEISDFNYFIHQKTGRIVEPVKSVKGGVLTVILAIIAVIAVFIGFAFVVSGLDRTAKFDEVSVKVPLTFINEKCENPDYEYYASNASSGVLVYSEPGTDADYQKIVSYIDSVSQTFDEYEKIGGTATRFSYSESDADGNLFVWYSQVGIENGTVYEVTFLSENPSEEQKDRFYRYLDSIKVSSPEI